jgi:cytochrome c5
MFNVRLVRRLFRLGAVFLALVTLLACDRSARQPVTQEVPSGQAQADVAGDTSAVSQDQETDQAERGNDPAYGEALYASTCTPCHGSRGQGMPHQGANLRTSRFIAEADNVYLVEFLKKGRSPRDPGSIMALLMPPRGGNAALDDTSLGDIVAFLRQIQNDARADDPAPVVLSR